MKISENIFRKEEQTRFGELDALRGVAAVGVMLFHYLFTWHQLDSSNIFSYGRYGVQLFFVISGFVIFMTLERTSTLKDFPVSRFARLYPTYWSAVIITLLIVSSGNFTLSTYSFFKVISNLTMFQHWMLVNHIDGVYWTLTVELNFYLLMAGLFYFNLLRKIVVLGIFLNFLCLLVNFLVSSYDLPIYFVFPLFHWWFLFFSGIIFYKIRFKLISHFTAYLILFLNLLVNYFLYDLESTFVLALIISCFLLFNEGYLTFLANRFFLYLGAISYSLYLVHAVNGEYYFTLIGHYTDSLFLKVLLSVLISITMASTITYLIERPVSQFIRIRYKLYKSRKFLLEGEIN